MRRSAAPSQRFKSPIPGLTKPASINENLAIKTPENHVKCSSTVRSTSSILNILKKTISEVTQPQAEVAPKVQETEIQQVVSDENKRTYSVVWGKKSTKKHKTWEGDGILEVIKRSAILKDSDGNVMGRATNLKVDLIQDGYILSVGGKEVQIGDLIPNCTIIKTTKRVNSDDAENLKQSKKIKYKSNSIGPLSLGSVVKRKTATFNLDYQPLVFPQPNSEHQWTYNDSKRPVVDVSVDSCLAKVLRPHQRQGVVFLYESILGYRSLDNFGAILADEMGLGKTLQCITVVWTLLKQGPYGGTPILNRVLIVTPSSLTGNWEKEFLAWLGRERIRVFVVDNKNKPKDYAKMSHVPILIISYEMFVRYFDELNEIKFDLMICDEGHRLKNAQIKASTLLNQIACKRRVILTGTPIQNDLQEFYALIDFVNPGILGSMAEYRKYYETCIIASREPDIDFDVKQLGEERAKELNKKTAHFILRRTQDVLDKYLPTKTEVVVFCKSSALQQDLYSKVVDLWENRETSSKDVQHLTVITALKKICNHPTLLKLKSEESLASKLKISHSLLKHNQEILQPEDESLTTKLSDLLPPSLKMSVADSGKLKVLLDLLKNMCDAKEKLVIVSSFTQTLDLIATVCEQNGFKFGRLDGSVPSAQRTKIVEHFNNKWSVESVFLLSAKAGGVGLNLIGASRLVLFDSDWNPATDLQAMSRVWRDGQKKSVFLYRFLTSGTIEEKIYQRQISKTGLSGTIVDPNNTTSIRMSDEELKNLFSLKFDSDCSTHALLNCDCICDGSIPEPRQAEVDKNKRECQLGVEKINDTSLRMNQLMQWEHHSQPFNQSIIKQLRLDNVSEDVSFMFRNQCSL